MAKTQGQTGTSTRVDNASAEGGSAPLDVNAAGTADKKDYRSKEPKMYRAIARGYVDGAVREPGEVFGTREPKGSWMEEVKAKGSALDRAVSDTQASKSDDPDLESFAIEALQARALDLGLTSAKGLSKNDLIAAIRAAHDEDRAR